ncbi:HBS1-like protein [Phytophthora cactorum]|uniref:HBS1-like protein n=2 Tax=Phytophthora cactorum TaxID=29920 RepID=A0A8T1FSI5_9STRA|nr:HBS1-like protein [Phytophthora cactorum]KAG2804063.1 HBS1-like protein [Phytophthora cactorum]KAG2855598.1 HBS1-like protein [Phytophthora cactorum]KAG2892632.1 HBS1-like protein [Phytophthora cactorum]KAG2896421.1 HBS1-like protein [Phytophthora cactorum]
MPAPTPSFQPRPTSTPSALTSDPISNLHPRSVPLTRTILDSLENESVLTVLPLDAPIVAGTADSPNLGAMSRHRNVRNRAYSYEDEDYDEYYDDYEPSSPNNEFMYRRDSPSRQRSVFSFVQQEETEQEPTSDPGDAEILEAMVPQVQQAMGSRFSSHQITQELRSANYDLDKTVVALLEKGKAPAAAGGVLPLQIQIPRLEAVALAIGNEVQTESKPKKEIVMPAPAKGKAMAIGALPSTPKKAEEEKKPRISAADAVNAAPAISRAQTQFTPAEKKAFERAELKTQEQAVKLEEEARTGGKTKISMVVIGHVDAGKSTITGHLLYKLGYVSKRLMHKYEKESREAGKSSFAYAWVMDADEEERSRGVTMDVGTSHFETETKHVTLLDAPGHRDFIPKMIAGAAQADVAVLVVPAVTGEFEAAFENSGQTKEHTLLVRSLGVAQMVVAVNKMDMVNWDKERFDNIVQSLSTFLQGAGFRPKNLRFVPLSGMTGANLEKTGGVEECSWYSGPSLVEAIDTFAPPQRQISKPFRMTVSDVSKSMSLGQTISGRVYAGAAAVGDSFLLMPIGLPLTVKGMEQDGKSCTLARAGDTIEMGVTGIDPSALTTGSILCSIASPVQLAKKFEAKIMTMPAVEVPLVKGTYVTIHMHNVDEPVNITRLVSMLSKTGEVEKKKPRCITRERSAVVQITCHRKICLEEFANYRQLGRFTLRDRGKTLAAGIITQIIA